MNVKAGNQSSRLEFFDRDPVDWREHSMGDLHRRLLALKKANSGLWNGRWGAGMIQVLNCEPASVFNFVRANDNRAFADFNFSAEPREVTFEDSLHHGRYRDFASGAEHALDADLVLRMPAWSHRVFVR